MPKTTTRQLASSACLALALLAQGCGNDSTSPDPPVAAPDPLTLEAPLFFPRIRIPEDNPLTVQGVALGRKLFYDTILSRDQTQACASCHAQEFGFSDHGRRFSEGIHGTEGTRNAPAIINPVWIRSAFWDGRQPSLEDQAREPVPNPIEMDLPWDEAIPRLQGHPDYPALFEAAFLTPEITENRVVQALAQFERTLISANSKFDKRQRGEAEFTPAEERGFELFFTETGDCFHCHGNILFTTDEFRDIGLELNPAEVDSGRARVTGNASDLGKFRTPTLRNIEYTAPYMHDGRYATLEEVVRHYEEHIERSDNLDVLLLTRLDRINSGLALTDQDIDDLVTFLETLSDPDFINNPEFSDPEQ
jgi:cytochrome c peroxidase